MTGLDAACSLDLACVATQNARGSAQVEPALSVCLSPCAGAIPPGPYHRNMNKGWEQQLADVKELWHRNVSSEFAPDIIVVSALYSGLAVYVSLR
jgi:hypothetical protein